MIDPVRPGVVNPSLVKHFDTAVIKQGSAPVARTLHEEKTERRGVTSLLPLGDIVAKLAAGGPPVDDRRVMQLRSAIAEGRYRINADTIATAMSGFATKV
jgi:flagellar biosynthesis anti-sigma factor FlgM